MSSWQERIGFLLCGLLGLPEAEEVLNTFSIGGLLIGMVEVLWVVEWGQVVRWVVERVVEPVLRLMRLGKGCQVLYRNNYGFRFGDQVVSDYSRSCVIRSGGKG
jgi:hypothetical protein